MPDSHRLPLPALLLPALAMLLVLLVLLALLASPAWGHTVLVQVSPAAGSVLQDSPKTVVLVFSEPVEVLSVGLRDPQGREWPVTARASAETVEVTVPSSDIHGTWLLDWRVAAADGHPIGGTLDYSIGSASTQGAAAHGATATAAHPWRSGAIWLARWLTWLGLFAVVGAGLFRTMAPEQRVGPAGTMVAATVVLLVIDLGLQGLDLLDAPASAVFAVPPWQQALGSSYALTLGCMALALAAAWPAMRAPGGPRQKSWAIVALLLVGVSAMLSGHVGTAPPQWLTRPLVTLHVALAAAWFGCLIPLVRLLRADLAGQARVGPALARFSRWIAPAVALLVLSGIGLASRQLSGPPDLLQTAYGRVLLVKLILVACLLGLAAINRWRNTRPALAGEPDAKRRLVRVTRLELVLAIALLAVVSVWRLTPPPRSLVVQEVKTAIGVLSSDIEPLWIQARLSSTH